MSSFPDEMSRFPTVVNSSLRSLLVDIDESSCDNGKISFSRRESNLLKIQLSRQRAISSENDFSVLNSMRKKNELVARSRGRCPGIICSCFDAECIAAASPPGVPG